jgi:hypothetical protein
MVLNDVLLFACLYHLRFSLAGVLHGDSSLQSSIIFCQFLALLGV